MIQRARHPVGGVIERGIAHITYGAVGQVLAQLPAHGGAVGALAVRLVHPFAPGVRERLVNRAALVVVEKVRLVLGDPVGYLVTHHIVGQRPALAEYCLFAVPERVVHGAGPVRIASVNGGQDGHVRTVDAVAIVVLFVEVVGIFGEEVWVIWVQVASVAFGSSL